MPTVRVSVMDGADGVEAAVELLEADGHKITGISRVGDQHLIVFDTKPKVGRPKSKPMETR